MKKIITFITLVFMQSFLAFAHTDENIGGHHMMDSVWWGMGVYPMFMGIAWWILIILIIILVLVLKK
jgi:hypothetical protein